MEKIKGHRFCRSTSKHSQIWVETVIYTLIALTIIGIILAIATPTLNKYKDKMIIEQTINALNDLNGEILEVRDRGLGNKRSLEFGLKKGSLTIDSPNDKIIYVLEETELEYSEVGESINRGDLTITTEKKGRKYKITLSLEYEYLNITFNGKEEKKTFFSTSVPYKIFIENNGTIDGVVQLDITEA